MLCAELRRRYDRLRRLLAAASQPRKRSHIVVEPMLTVRYGTLAAVEDERQAQRGVVGIQAELATCGPRGLAVGLLARPLGATKVDQQALDAVLGGMCVELVGKPLEAFEAGGDVDFAGAIEHMNVVVLEVAIEVHAR